MPSPVPAQFRTPLGAVIEASGVIGDGRGKYQTSFHAANRPLS
jgi:hypothetical protein